jgi:hypothetical protein
MTIIPFRRASGSAKTSTKTPKRRKAILTIEPIPQKKQKRGANYESGLFTGKLIVEGHEFLLDDGHPLGMISYVCNVRSVTVSTSGATELFELRAVHDDTLRSIEQLADYGEKVFLKRFHSALYLCHQSNKQKRDFVDWWEKDLMPFALSQVPEALHANIKLQRGVYDESGMPMSAAAIAHRARHGLLVGQLVSAGQGLPTESPRLFDIDFTQITRLKGDVANGDNMDPVVYSGDAELAICRLAEHYGFDRLPLTWGELNGVLDYCEILWLAAGGGIPSESIMLWQASARKADIKNQPWRVPAFDAYIAGDIEKLRSIHVAERTIERVAAEWKEFPYPEGHPLADL